MSHSFRALMSAAYENPSLSEPFAQTFKVLTASATAATTEVLTTAEALPPATI